MINLKSVFDKPKIVGIVADTNTGKSNLIYYLIKELQANYDFRLFSYGLKADLGEIKINSLEELEQIKDSVIFVDEYYNLFDLEDRKKRRSIEHALRLINHNNNVFVLCGLPDNFKRFISSKIEVLFFKKSTVANFINGSTVKNVAVNYRGLELGSTILNVQLDKVLLFDGLHYSLHNVPYMEEYDSKKNNVQLLVDKSVPNIVQKSFINEKGDNNVWNF